MGRKKWGGGGEIVVFLIDLLITQYRDILVIFSILTEYFWLILKYIVDFTDS